MGEDVTDMATTTSQLQAKLLALTGGQVDIMLDANTFKNSTQIIREMADAWEDMNDIQRASALELMGGKRQANVLSALIQNFDTVEKVIETSANSAGSALKENERYLDSIQGKIDQFNNAMQSMWSNTLDSDLVKGIVTLGTEIIKIIDKIGMLNSALLALGAYKGIKLLFKSFQSSAVPLKVIWQYINQLTVGFRGFTAAQVKANAATAAGNLVNNQYTAGLIRTNLIQWLTKKSTDALEAAKYQLWLAEKGLEAGIATTADVQAAQAAVQAASIPVDYAKMTTTQLLSAGFAQLAASVWGATKAIISFLLTNPVGWAILAIGAIAGGIAVFSSLHKTTEELAEELDDLKSELSDLRSELDSVNSELETTQDRMAELLAMDSLTFEEQEELDRLRETNDELERRKELLEDQEKLDKARVGRQAARVVESAKNDRTSWMGALNPDYEDNKKKNKVLEYISSYDSIESKMAEATSLEEQEKLQKKLDKEASKIDAYIKTLSDALEGVEYGDSEESDEALDYLAEIESKYAIARGSKSAKSNAVRGVLAKDEFAETKTAIDGYVKALEGGNKTAATAIAQIISGNEELVEDLEARGVEAQDAIDYYTKLGSEANYATVDGKIKEIDRASATFEALLSDKKFNVDGLDIGLGDLFDEEGKIIQTKLSQVFNDTSDQTRGDITRLLEGSYDQIKNGTKDTEKLLTGFGLAATKQVLDVQNKLLGEQNLELFPNLKDEISGIIDTFAEFSKAVGGVVDALDTLDKARAEEAYSGSISIETLENLMKYTDDYAELIEVDETGAITLATNAEEILIGKRLEKIKTDAAAAVQTAQTNLEQAKYNAKAVNETGPIQEAMTAATDGLAGAWAYLGSMIGDVTDGNFSGMLGRASDAYNKATTGRKEKRAQVNVSVEDAEEALAKALDQQKIANALTPENAKKKYSSEEASGGNATKEDANKDLIEEGWEKLVNEYENKIALITNERDLIQAEIDKAEARGGKASIKYYEDLKRGSEEEKELLIQKKAALEEYLAANANSIDQDTWTEYNNEINETAVAIKECEVNTIEWADAIREIDLHYFEQINDELGRLGEELEFVNSLLEDEEVADENGNWSAAALTRMGMYTQQMEIAAADVARYQGEIDDLNEAYAKGERSEEQYQEELSNLVSGQQDAIQSYEDAKDSIVELNEARIDAIRTGIEKEIEAYSDLTDAKKKELDAERDLHDFREGVKDQTKDIAELERHISSLSGSSAASDIAERRRLEAQLMEAKEGLNDTYYNHSRDAQSDALDEENEAYAQSKEKYIEQLEGQLKDTETLIQNSIMDVMLNADLVYTELNELADLYGIDLSESLTQPWKDASAQATAWKDELKNSMTAGEYAALIGDGGAITGFANGVATKLEGSWSQAQTAAQNYAGYLTGEELKNKFANTLTGFGNQIQAIIDKWNGVKSAADAAYAAQTRIHDVGGNENVVDDPPQKDPVKSDSDYVMDVPKGVKPDVKEPTVTTPARPASPTRPTFKKVGDLWSGVGHTGVSVGKKTYNKASEVEGNDGIYYPYTNGNGYKGYIKKGEGYEVLGNGKMDILSFKPLYQKYVKGTTGTKRDEWALTDEPGFGDELVLIPGKDGNLSFMRKGTSVVPADITQKLLELAQIPTSDLMNKNLTAIVPNVTKNDFKNEFNFDSLVHVDTVDSDTLPKLEKMVDKKIDDFSKALNYSIKRFAR